MTTRSALRAITLLLCLGTWVARPAAAAVRVTVVDAARVSAGTVQEAGESTASFRSRAGVPLQLYLSPAAAGAVNVASDGTFHPFAPDAVRAGVEEMAVIPGPDLAVTIYCLPGLPSVARASFAAGHEIFLAPGVGEVSAKAAAYTVAHELGHVVQHALLPEGDPSGWGRYLAARGLTDATRYSARAAHRDRPAEIFAEDFRALFGGPLATASGTIENPDLAMPQAVTGLPELIAQLLSRPRSTAPALRWVDNYPNPFNPSTTVRFVVRDDLANTGGTVRVEVLDARGRRVRELDPVPLAPEISAHWDGADAHGQPAATGRYFVRALCGGESCSGTILLLK